MRLGTKPVKKSDLLNFTNYGKTHKKTSQQKIQVGTYNVKKKELFLLQLSSYDLC